MKLSIGLITYNHESFIEQAVAGILSQRTDFDYEILLGEDCSTDDTRRIIAELAARHPQKIRILETPHNLGMNANYLRTLQACRGEYIALLDGDDYWCDEHKLQRQVDFLDRRPEYAISFHAVRKVYEDGSHPDKILRPRRGVDDYTLPDLLTSMFIPTCSAVLRSRAVSKIPEWVYRMRTTDHPIMLVASEHGKIGYMDEVMAVYRVHDGGAWTSMHMIDRIMTNILLLETANANYDYQ